MKRIKSLLLLAAALLSINNVVCAEGVLRMATTTSTENSGLLGVLNLPFEQKYGARVDVIAVGTGKALRLGANGDVDIVFVHDPAAEEKFVEEGHGIERTAVMYNDFVLLGPAADPAGVKNSGSAAEAFKKIADSQAPFVSRGDDSGTHKKEQAAWKATGIEPHGDWYASAGQGMGAVLRIADDKNAYTLCDRGTYLAYREKIVLTVLFEGDPALFNPYHIMAVNPKSYPHVNYDLAKKYIEYITGPEGQSIIANFRVGGKPLFYPDAMRQPSQE